MAKPQKVNEQLRDFVNFLFQTFRIKDIGFDIRFFCVHV